MNLGDGFRRAARLPLLEALRRGAGEARREIEALPSRLRDPLRATYSQPRDERLARRIEAPPIDLVRQRRREIGHLAGNHLRHRFDLLGSGPVEVRHGAACHGLEGHRYEPGPAIEHDVEGRWLEGRVNAANASASRRIWSMIDPGYVPIDWQLDSKSGYRWSERMWFRDVRYGHLPGVDVKVPWELARMQHLSELAFAFALARHGEPGFEAPERYARELRSELLDFIAANPPRFGVNWRSTMDVAIRVANWLVARDLLLAFGAGLDAAFESVLAASVRDHARHVWDNLVEYGAERGNHHLASVVGLLFAAAWLPRDAETERWLGWAKGDLVSEVLRQFRADGSCFEGSTSYHRLSAEIVVFGAALILGLAPERPQEESRFPLAFVERLERAEDLARDLIGFDGRVPQIGDNDSGRFLKLGRTGSLVRAGTASARYLDLVPAGLPADTPWFEEDHLDQRHVLEGFAGLFGRDDRSEGAASLDASVVRSLSRGRTPSPTGAARSTETPSQRVGSFADWLQWGEEAKSSPEDRRLQYVFRADEGDLRRELRAASYPDFGLYLLLSSRLRLVIRCAGSGVARSGAHRHDDELSIDLWLDGETRIADPGTYLYTPLPGRRNEYRSSSAHFVPRVAGREPARLDRGLFRLEGDRSARCLYFGPEGFVGMHCAYGEPVYRRIAVREAEIVVTDWSSLPLERSWAPLPFSPGYGLRCREGGGKDRA